MKHCLLFCLLLLPFTACQGQGQLSDYLGAWTGEFPSSDAFVFDIRLQKDSDASYQLIFQGKQKSLTLILEATAPGYFLAKYEDQMSFHLHLSDAATTAFIETGNHLTYLDLKPGGEEEWTATWNLFTAQQFDPTFYLSLDRLEDGTNYASTFFQSPVLHYMLAQDFTEKGPKFNFRDIRSGLHFTGELKEQRIELTLAFLLEQMTVSMHPTEYSAWRIGQPDPGTTPHVVRHDDSRFEQLTKDILSDTLEQTHAVLIQQGEKTIYEHYFDGFDEQVTHDTRSVAKSFSSALVGVAIEDGFIPDEQQVIKPYYEKAYPGLDWSDGKGEITLFHLLTMSSGLDAIDFGLNRMSFANEGNFQRQDDWSGYILSAPMVNTPGSHANYGSGNPHLLGAILRQATKQPVAPYLHQQLFAPLGINNYRIQVDNIGKPYFGGGWYLTASGIASFGRLYLEKGKRNGQRVLTREWVDKSFDRHLILENTFDLNPYGYFFWHKDYEIKGKTISSVEARGTGGQYLFVIAEYDLVVVILSGNYSNNKGFQPERIMRDYILPIISQN